MDDFGLSDVFGEQFWEDPQTLALCAASLLAGLAVLWPLMRGKKAPVLLQDPKVYEQVILIEKENVSHDVRRLRFELPDKNMTLGLPVGKHVYLRATINGEVVVRPYTPVTSETDKGYFDLVLKIYFKGTNDRFPDGGKMTQYLEALTIGTKVDVRGPTGDMTYHGKGKITLENRKGEVVDTRHAKHVGMIAGGTGITPMLQIIRDVLSNPDDDTTLSLLFANKEERDILVQHELEECAKNPKFHLWYTLDDPPADWKFSKGFISEEMIREHLPAPGPDTQILLCGPPPMIKFACVPNLEKLGFTPANYIKS